jgi:hypothetical protein
MTSVGTVCAEGQCRNRKLITLCATACSITPSHVDIVNLDAQRYGNGGDQGGGRGTEFRSPHMQCSVHRNPFGQLLTHRHRRVCRPSVLLVRRVAVHIIVGLLSGSGWSPARYACQDVRALLRHLQALKANHTVRDRTEVFTGSPSSPRCCESRTSGSAASRGAVPGTPGVDWTALRHVGKGAAIFEQLVRSRIAVVAWHRAADWRAKPNAAATPRFR